MFFSAYGKIPIFTKKSPLEMHLSIFVKVLGREPLECVSVGRGKAQPRNCAATHNIFDICPDRLPLG
jgi:hypothetical protein